MSFFAIARLAWADLRGSFANGLSGFRVLLAGLTLGVAAVAASGTVVESVQAGLTNSARVLLGGDATAQRLYAPPSEADLNLFQSLGKTSTIATARVMARRDDGTGRSVLAELKAVDAAYPLIGQLTLSPNIPPATAFAAQNGVPGIAVEAALLRRMGIVVGDAVRIGTQSFQVRAIISQEPDAAGGAFRLGPRIMTDFAGLQASGLIQPGSLITYKTRILAPTPRQDDKLASTLQSRLNTENWRILGLDDSARRSQRFLETVGKFLTWAGLTALLVGGVGVASAVAAAVDQRRTVVAILKTQGATNRQIVLIQSLVIGAVATIGIALGLILGGMAPWPVRALITTEALPAAPIPAIYPAPLLQAAAFGALITAIFAWWPLLRVREIPAANLLRDTEGALHSPIPFSAWGLLAALIAMILYLMTQTGDTPAMGLGFAFGAVMVLALLRGIALVIQRIGVPLLLRPSVGLLGRLALTNLTRRHAPMVSMLVALGLGATVLVSLTQVQGTLSNQLGDARKDDYPTYFFIDIQPHQLTAFQNIIAETPGADLQETAPMVRGRVTLLNGKPADVQAVDPSVRWVLRGDRGFTVAKTLPRGADIIAGSWWPESVPPQPLVSVAENVAEGLGLTIGDTVTVNVLGREVTATITNLRGVNWASLNINFAFVFSPGVLDGAPQTLIATVNVPPEQEIGLEHALAETLPNVTAIRVADVLKRAQGISDVGGQAILAVTAVTVLAGLLVLGGAVSAGLRQRLNEAVILKVLGARRKDLLRVTAWEFLGIGLIVGAFAVIAGSMVSWAVVTFVLKLNWSPVWAHAGVVALACVVVGLCTGGLIAGRILSARPAQRLRHL